METDDETLLLRIREHDDMGAAGQLLRRYQNQIYAFVFGMLKEKHDAEDVVQETFTKALAHLDSYTERHQFKAWLFRIARNEAVTIIRRRKRTVLQESPYAISDDDPFQPMNQEPRQVLERREALAALDSALERLPSAEKEVVVLRLKAEVPFKEIASIMNCSINTVLGRMHNAKKRLKQLLEEQPV